MGLFTWWVTGRYINSAIDFALQFLIDPSLFYLAGRITNVFFSLLTIFIFYTQTRKLFNETTARFSAVIAMFGYYFIQFSRFAVTDTLLILFSSLATLSFLKTYIYPSKRNYILSGSFMGLSIGTKYNAGFLILGIFTTIILHWIQQKRENCG